MRDFMLYLPLYNGVLSLDVGVKVSSTQQTAAWVGPQATWPTPRALAQLFFFD